MQKSDSIKKQQTGKAVHDSEATSKKTLEDLEEETSLEETEDTHDSTMPSPDGAFDETDDLSDAGPL